MISVEFLTLIGVIITAIAAVAVALINLHQNSKIAEIHFLVNDRLDTALDHIRSLEARLREQGGHGV